MSGITPKAFDKAMRQVAERGPQPIFTPERRSALPVEESDPSVEAAPVIGAILSDLEWLAPRKVAILRSLLTASGVPV